MKKILFAIVGVITFLSNSCNLVLQDESNCSPENNLTLHFSKLDPEGKDIFSASIDDVKIFLFDADSKRLAYTYYIPRESLTHSSVSMYVRPARYQVVCWGNARENTKIAIAEKGHLNDGRVSWQLKNGVIEKGDPLYFAPFNRQNAQTFLVPENEKKDVTILFRAAHIKLDITLKDYTVATGETADPYIEVTDLFHIYDFTMMQQLSERRSHIQQTVPVSIPRVDDIRVAFFNTPRFVSDNDITIHVRGTASDASIKSIKLKDELAARDMIIDEQVDEVTLTLEIKFIRQGDNVVVKVTFGEWEGSDITPGLH